MFENNFLTKLQRKFGRFAIKSLMMYIVGTMGLIFAVEFIMNINLVGMFAFDVNAIMQGEVWRVITFIFIPPGASIIFIFFALYLYWIIGSALEAQWGAFKFNIFYLCGMLGTIAAGLITGFATNFYLNLSLFLAFAILYPNFEIRLFFILPIKMKWMALVNVVFFAFSLVINTWPVRAALLVSIINIFLFFGKDFINIIKNKHRKAQWKRNNR
ncbi:MAG: hypothetical protein FWC76_02340 [Defluviitaleaceae bacterium]|nr:hypothetical protein [Defluviitaleaceae bacterium]